MPRMYEIEKKSPSKTMTGVQGVRMTQTGRYQSHVTFMRKSYNAGTYDTIEEALEARFKKFRQLQVEYAKAILKEYGEEYDAGGV